MKSFQKLLKITIGLFLILPFVLLHSCSDDDNFTDVVPDFSQAIIRSFEVDGEFAEIDHTSATISMTLPAGTDLSAVTVDLQTPEGTTVDPESGSTLDFSEGPVIFTTQAENGANREYTAMVAAYGDPKFLNFSIGENAGEIDHEENSVTVNIGSEDGDITSLAPNFVIPEGTSVDIASGVSRDFSGPVVYTITSNDGFTAAEYTVTVNQIEGPKINSFVIGEAEGIIDNEENTIEILVPVGTDLSNLSPEITIPEGQTISPESGEEVDFTEPVEYTVTNTEDITKTYVVSVEAVDPTGRVAFISGADRIKNISEPDTKAAANWLRNNYSEDFIYLQSGELNASDLEDTEVLYFYWDNTDSPEMPDGGISEEKIQIITDYYKNGGNLIISGFAINHLDAIGRINLNGTVLTNEGGNTGPASPNGDTWGLRYTYEGAPDYALDHPILEGLQNVEESYPMNNAAFKEDRNFGIDFGPYGDLFTTEQCTEARAREFENLTNSILIRWYEWLESRGCGIGVAEFKPTEEFKGTMILNTGGWLEWSMEDNNGATNDYQENIHLLTQNMIDYLLDQ